MNESMSAGARVGEEDVEYESDPEEAKLSLKMRRREASDDEEESCEESEKQIPPRRIDSDGESDRQGGFADFEEEEEDGEEGEDGLEYFEEYGVEYVEEGKEYVDGGLPASVEVDDEAQTEPVVALGGPEVIGEGLAVEAIHKGLDGEDGGHLQAKLVEKKEHEPYAVPTAGAFYMHDDRFGDNARGRQRWAFGVRKLWECKDDLKWGHDKFEELTMEDRRHDGGRRNSRGHYRGRGKQRGADPAYPRGRRPRAYGNENNYNSESRVYANNQKFQNTAPRGIRGQWPRRYRPTFKANEDAPPQSKHPGMSAETPSQARSRNELLLDASNVEVVDPEPTSKQGFVSSLSYASPPFYPSNAKDMNTTHARDLQSGSNSRNDTQSFRVRSSPFQSSSILRGKNVTEAIAVNKISIDGAVPLVAGKPSTTMQLVECSSFPKSIPPRVQGRAITTNSLMNFQPTVQNSQVDRGSLSNDLESMQKKYVHSRGQPFVQATGKQYNHHHGAGSQASSPPKNDQPVNVVETTEIDIPSDSSKINNAVTKGKGSMNPSGKGSIVYAGTQVMGGPGNTGSTHGDQSFSATPAFLPVMQLGGQHPGGMGVPAVGMAFPGYMAQPQLGLGSSEMTWLPVLAGAAGALGAQYCSPYIAVDGAYHGRPPGQISSLTASLSMENNNTKNTNEGMPSQKPELGSDDIGQRQKNPRRYTEMKFDQ
ncbi:unnamed protein product [Cuscuta epithymum]|uniref:Btz domain-containing protein n=1 Tax=Cuscuta epithymum TaxID=186058 RepID=A0AAV0GG91_9ASTE|nr:unnamed protein product [Cuscuta epithymum]